MRPQFFDKKEVKKNGDVYPHNWYTAWPDVHSSFSGDDGCFWRHVDTTSHCAVVCWNIVKTASEISTKSP
jgi:hypothetical protein